MILTASIPKNILYIGRNQTQKSEWSWDDTGFKENKGPVVRSVFPVDPEKPKTIETARRWSGKNPFEFTAPNDPFMIDIISLEHRSEGGRAYKCCFMVHNAPDDIPFYADLREDVLLDTILRSTIVNGQPRANFIWAKVGSQMKLVRCESNLHEAIIKIEKNNSKGKISKNDFVIGGIYINKMKKRYVYCGEYWMLSYNEALLDEMHYNKQKHNYRSTNKNHNVYLDKTEFESLNICFTKKQAWYAVGYGQPKINTPIQNYNMHRTKSANFIAKTGDINVPNNWLEQRKLMPTKFKVQESVHRPGKLNYDYISVPYDSDPDLLKSAAFNCIYPLDQEPFLGPEYKRILEMIPFIPKK